MTSPSSDESLIARLLALPAAERMFALHRACAEDEALNARLPEIMAALAAATDFPRPLEEDLSPESAVEALRTALEVPPAETAGTRIGPYKLLQEIGRGGFGVVWMAEQEGPIRRRVALKIIKAGMDTKEVIARFEAERQALALMDHPNIARVFDAGATDSGRPFFVMELVRGVAITRYCDENRLPVGARLRLFMLVCQAVQHAHQKGIIHRDLKPSNILVTLHDGVAVPKVIDFGIAKATTSQLTEKTLFTQFHAFIGTPAYTSPEQMEMSGLDIDTRSDIYSLGVLLYELLAGRPPFDSGELVKAGLEAMRRTIREVDPPRPSHRLTTMDKEERVTIAQQRGTEAAKLSLLLHGDLDWIVMRCLEKDRARRYDTATGLAQDLERHLENEPVAARPPSAAYVLRKFIRRNRLAFIAGSTVAVALVAGLVASTWEAVRARRAERGASQERARAEDMLTFMLGDLRGQLAKVGRLDVLESVGDKAMAYFASRDARELSDAELARYSKALTQIGAIRMDETRYSEAAAAFSEAYSRSAALAARHPGDGDMLFERGQAEYWNGVVHMERGELSAVADWWSRYDDTCLALVALDPSRTAWRHELAYGQQCLAVLHQARGEFDAARAGFLEKIATLETVLIQTPGDLETLYEISDAHSWLGTIAAQQGEFSEASKQFSLQTSQLGQIVSKEPGNARWRGLLAQSAIFNQADVDLATGQLPAAEERLGEARRLVDGLTAQDPANRHWLSLSLEIRLYQAILLRRQGDPAEAGRLIGDILPQIESLSAAEPTDHRNARWVVKAWRVEAQLRASSDPQGAASAAARAVELAEKPVREGRASDGDAGEYAMAWVVAGEIAANAGAGAEARRDWMHAAQLLAPRIPGTSDWELLDPAARAAAWLGRPDDVRAAISKLTRLGYVPLDPWPDVNPASGISNPKQ